jgi:hypothetical protein
MAMATHGWSLCEKLNLQPNGSIISLANFVASAYMLLWPTFLEILQSHEICLVLEDLVSMVAMIESSRTWKGKFFLTMKSRECVVAFCTSHKIQLLGMTNGRRRFGTRLQPTTIAIAQLEENAKIS